jgi:Leucine-rich repeat (LRR) protein
MTDQSKSATHHQGYQEAQHRILAKVAGGRELELGNLGLTAVPPEIGQLTSLKKLWLHGNQLTSLPPEIGRLGSLKLLNLGTNWPRYRLKSAS